MDAAFEILIPSNESLAPFEFKPHVFEWDGVEYPQNDPVCIIDSFKLSETPYPDYILFNLPPIYRNVSWQCVSISGEGLDLLNG